MAIPTQPRSYKTDPAELVITELPKVSVKVAAYESASKYTGDGLVYACTCSDSERDSPVQRLSEDAAAADASLSKGMLADAAEESKFTGKKGTSVVVNLPRGNSVRYLGVMGLGCVKSAESAAIGMTLASIARDYPNTKKIGLVLPRVGGCPHRESAYRNLQAALESFLVELQADHRYKGTGSKDLTETQLEEVTIFARDDAAANAAVQRARAFAEGVHLARQLVNAPANVCTTITLAQAAEAVAKKAGLICKVLQPAEIEALGMGSYLAVAKGSLYPPQFIHLTYRSHDGAERKKTRLAFVGKGLCFDAGGYNLKCGAGSQIALMKFDMGGAAAVLGAAHSIGLLQPSDTEVHFIVAAAENMISKQAYRPGDVITASNGKTIEVGNTDAEGRLTLADALVYAEKLQVQGIIDIATLTGACIVALGPEIAALIASDDEIAKNVLEAANSSGEKMWQLPLAMHYREGLDSKIADLNNIGGKGGGTIVAAIFLSEFVNKTPWAHIDIAGPAWHEKNGATGYGVRTLVEYALQTANKDA